MADFPCLPLWTDAYLADTSHLTTEEHGAYLLLLIQAWRSADCSLPDDDVMLSRHTGLSMTKWLTAKPIVMSFWKLDAKRGRWFQKRLKKERSNATEKRRKARDSAVTRWNKSNPRHANAMRTQCSPEPKPIERPNGLSQRAVARKKSDLELIAERFDNG